MKRRILAAMLFAMILGGCGQTGTVNHHLRVGVARHRVPVQLLSAPAPTSAPAASGAPSPMVVYDEMPHWM